MQHDRILATLFILVFIAVALTAWLAVSVSDTRDVALTGPPSGDLINGDDTTRPEASWRRLRQANPQDAHDSISPQDAEAPPRVESQVSAPVAATLEGTLRGEFSECLAQAFAVLSFPYLRGHPYVTVDPQAEIDAEGRFRFEGLSEGQSVRVAIVDREDRSGVFERSGVIRLKPGRNEIVLEIYPGARLVADLGGLTLPRPKMTAMVVPARNLGLMPAELLLPYERGGEQAYVRKLDAAQRLVVARANPGRYRLLLIEEVPTGNLEFEMGDADLRIDPQQRMPFWVGPEFSLREGDFLRISVGSLQEPATLIARHPKGRHLELRALGPEVNPENRGQIVRPFISATAWIKVVAGRYEFRVCSFVGPDGKESADLHFSPWRRIELRAGEQRELDLNQGN